jgi:hypothetical protein
MSEAAVENPTGTETPAPAATSRTQEEPPTPPAQVSGQSDPKMYSEEDLAKAREQEKTKVYKRLETLQETVQRLEAEARERQEAEEARQRALKEAEEQERLDNMSAKELIAEKEREWAEQQQRLREEIEAERALRERESQFAELMHVREQVLDQYRDRVAPELLDLIQGDSPEAIQASAENMAERTERILAQTQEAMQNARQQMPTARVTAPATGENTGSERAFTPDDIRNMSMADYAKHRQRLLGQGADGPKSRGLFG